MSKYQTSRAALKLNSILPVLTLYAYTLRDCLFFPIWKFISSAKGGKKKRERENLGREKVGIEEKRRSQTRTFVF